MGYLLLPSIAEDKLPAVVGKIKEAVAKLGYQELDSEEPFKIDLAYTMSKTVGASRYVVDEAYIGWLKFEALPEKVADIKDEVSRMEEVLRLLVIQAPKESAFTFAKAREVLMTKEAEQFEGSKTEGGEAVAVEEPVVQ